MSYKNDTGHKINRDTQSSPIILKRQTALLYAEYFKNNMWQATGNIFPSKLYKGKYFDYVCDDHNIAMAMVFGQVNVDSTKISPIEPVDHIDGLPDDLSDKVEKIVHFVKHPDTKFCYFTLRDVLNYDWETKIKLYGFIPEHKFRQYNAMQELPKNYCNNIMRRYKKEFGKLVTQYEMLRIIHGEIPREPNANYQVIYPYSEQSVSQYCKFFLNETLPVLKNIVPKKGRYDLVRLISITQGYSMYDICR